MGYTGFGSTLSLNINPFREVLLLCLSSLVLLLVSYRRRTLPTANTLNLPKRYSCKLANQQNLQLFERCMDLVVDSVRSFHSGELHMFELPTPGFVALEQTNAITLHEQFDRVHCDIVNS